MPRTKTLCPEVAGITARRNNDMGLIYCIINNLNGSIYVGKSLNFNNRVSHYRNNHHKCQPKLYNATQKYGWHNFSFEIIEDEIPRDKLSEREFFWIKHLCAVEFGYNCSYDTIMGQRSHSAESRSKMAKARTGIYIGERSPRYRKAHSDVTKDKISRKLTGRKSCPELVKALTKYKKDNNEIWINSSPNKKMIICVESNKTYVSIKQAAKDMNLRYQNISAHLNKKLNKNGKLIARSVGGFTFLYV